MKNKWRTLKELIAESHKYPVRIEGFIKGSGEISKIQFWLCGVSIEGNAIVQQPNKKPLTSYDEYGWRIYEEPKQPKKWAPVLYKVDSKSNWEMSTDWYSSHDESVNDLHSAFHTIWPAPGFTPVEIPE